MSFLDREKNHFFLEFKKYLNDEVDNIYREGSEGWIPICNATAATTTTTTFIFYLVIEPEGVLELLLEGLLVLLHQEPAPKVHV